MGAVAEFEKNKLVLQLRVARKRIRDSGKKCEGRKGLLDRYGHEILEEVKHLRDFHGLTYSEISENLAGKGMVGLSGRPLTRGQNFKTAQTGDNMTGEQLQEVWERLGLSRKDLAEAFGVTDGCIWSWENNETCTASKQVGSACPSRHVPWHV